MTADKYLASEAVARTAEFRFEHCSSSFVLVARRTRAMRAADPGSGRVDGAGGPAGHGQINGACFDDGVFSTHTLSPFCCAQTAKPETLS